MVLSEDEQKATTLCANHPPTGTQDNDRCTKQQQQQVHPLVTACDKTQNDTRT